jgi:hypothetical protein
VQPVTIDQLRSQLAWDDVRREPLNEYQMVWFRAFPTDASLPSVDLLFSADATHIEQVGSGGWHTHPDDAGAAIEMARKIIHHELCVLEEYAADGRCNGSGPVDPESLFKTLSLNTEYVVRRFFGKPSVREEIDFSRYAQIRHLLVEKEHFASIQAAYKKLGMPAPLQ